jgi:hypothetical protein
MPWIKVLAYSFDNATSYVKTANNGAWGAWVQLTDANGKAVQAVNATTAENATNFIAARARYKSPPFTWASNTTFAYAHGLGELWKAFLILRCISAEHGYNAGDFAYNVQFWDGTNPASVLVTRANSSYVYLDTGDGYLRVTKSGNPGVAADYLRISESKWEIYLCVEK